MFTIGRLIAVASANFAPVPSENSHTRMESAKAGPGFNPFHVIGNCFVDKLPPWAGRFDKQRGNARRSNASIPIRRVGLVQRV
jgi:hypothetical protein